jgi:hypothetical protein
MNIMKPIATIAREYAEKNFTREFLDSCSDSWYFDSICWFEHKYNLDMDSDEVNKFSGEIQVQFDRFYTKEFGKRDDYYRLKGIMSDMKRMHDELNEILKRGTMQPHGVTLQSCMKHLTNMQFSLGLVRSSINRQYNFDENN